MNWKTYSLGDLGDFKNGLNYTQENEGLGLKVLSVKDFKDFRTPDIESLGEINPQGIKIEPFLLKHGDIIFVRSNGNKNLIGRSVFIETDIPNLSYSGFCIRMRPNIDNAIPKFLAYYFRSPIFRKQLSNLGGGTNINNLNQKVMKSFQISIPSISTQERIVKLISQYDDLIENNERRIALLEESVQRLYKEWFTRFRFPGHEHVKIVDGVPAGWLKTTYGEISQTIGGGTPSTNVNEYWDDGDITWFTPKDLTNNNSFVVLDSDKKITKLGLQKSSAKLLPPNTIMMSSRASIGYFGLFDGEAATNQGFISVIPNNEKHRMFILHNLSSRKEEIINLAGGSTYKEINKTTFRNMEIVIPTDSLAEEFETTAWDAISQVRLLMKQNFKLSQARDLLLPKLMSGELAA